MPSYRLTYFNGRGRAEGARLMFALAGQDFEDRRVDSDSWKELKPTTKFGQLPILEIDGKQFAQSRAIVTHLAREFGFYGKTNFDALNIEQVLSIVEDFLQAALKVRFGPEDKKEELGKEFKTNQLPKFLGWLETLLKENGNGYFVGDKVTVADVVAYDFIANVETQNAGCLKDFPLTKALVAKIGSLDNIKAYVAKRVETPF